MQCGRGWLRCQLKASWLITLVSSSNCMCPEGMEVASGWRRGPHQTFRKMNPSSTISTAFKSGRAAIIYYPPGGYKRWGRSAVRELAKKSLARTSHAPALLAEVIAILTRSPVEDKVESLPVFPVNQWLHRYLQVASKRSPKQRY